LGTLSFELLDQKFSKDATSTYDLSLLTGGNHFSYVVTSPQQQVLLLRNYVIKKGHEQDFRFQIQALLKQDENLRQAYRTSRFGVFNEVFSLIPQRLFQVEKQSSYLSHLTNHSIGSTAFDELQHLSAVNVYGVLPESARVKKDLFPDARQIHGISGLLSAYQRLADSGQAHQVFLNVYYDQFQIFVYQSGQLQFANAFEFQTAKDFIYFTMLVFDQFKLKPETVPLYLSGTLVENSEIYHLIYRYVRHIHFLGPPSMIQLESKWDHLPRHFYFDLFSLRLCE